MNAATRILENVRNNYPLIRANSNLAPNHLAFTRQEGTIAALRPVENSDNMYAMVGPYERVFTPNQGPVEIELWVADATIRLLIGLVKDHPEWWPISWRSAPAPPHAAQFWAPGGLIAVTAYTPIPVDTPNRAPIGAPPLCGHAMWESTIEGDMCCLTVTPTVLNPDQLARGYYRGWRHGWANLAAPTRTRHPDRHTLRAKLNAWHNDGYTLVNINDPRITGGAPQNV